MTKYRSTIDDGADDDDGFDDENDGVFDENNGETPDVGLDEGSDVGFFDASLDEYSNDWIDLEVGSNEGFDIL